MNFINVIIFFALIFFPILVSANIIILPIFILLIPTAWPFLGLFIFIVSLVESLIFQKILFKEFKKSFKLSLIINLITTVLGLGLISLIMVFKMDLLKDFNNIIFYLLFFISTFLIEAILLKLFAKNNRWKNIIITSFLANFISYFLILLFLLGISNLNQRITINENTKQENNNQIKDNYEKLPEQNIDDLKVFDIIEYEEGDDKTIKATLFSYDENGVCMFDCYFNVDFDGVNKIALKRYTAPAALTKESKIIKINDVYYLDFTVIFSDVFVYGHENNRMNLDTGEIKKISITHCSPTEKYREAIGTNNINYLELMEEEKNQNKDIDEDGIIGGNKCETTTY